MSKWSPCKRRDFIRKLRELGFAGPYPGGKHQFMRYQGHRLALPKYPEYFVPQLKSLLKEVESILGRKITLKEWSRL